jgi:hypothetical protein
MDDRETAELVAGDELVCPPGDDAWIVGWQACVVIDSQALAEDANRS